MTNTETIEGGAYQDANGNWVNANGEPLTKEQIKQAESMAAQRQEQQDAQPQPAQPAQPAPTEAAPSVPRRRSE